MIADDVVGSLDDLGIRVEPTVTREASSAATAASARNRVDGSNVNRAGRRAIGRFARTAVGRRLLAAALKDEDTLGWALMSLSDQICLAASFDEAQPADIDEITSFEDCAWLFSSNALNHRLSRLEVLEAAYLFRLVRSLEDPLVGEIGRFKGGSTFLLAAAGARVVSIDNDLERQAVDAPPLARALERYGLRDRVEIVIGDSRTYPVERGTFDLVFVDGDHRYEGVRADFEHWWPAVANGGHMLFHDAEREMWTPSPAPRAQTEGVIRLVAEVASREDVVRVPGAPGTFAHFVKGEATGGAELAQTRRRPSAA